MDWPPRSTSFRVSGVNFLLNWDSIPIPSDVYEISELGLLQVEDLVLYFRRGLSAPVHHQNEIAQRNCTR